MAKKPTIRRGPASAHEGRQQTIREVHAGDVGCLLSATLTDDGALVIDVYRADPGVTVQVGSAVKLFTARGRCVQRGQDR